MRLFPGKLKIFPVQLFPVHSQAFRVKIGVKTPAFPVFFPNFWRDFCRQLFLVGL